MISISEEWAPTRTGEQWCCDSNFPYTQPLSSLTLSLASSQSLGLEVNGQTEYGDVRNLLHSAAHRHSSGCIFIPPPPSNFAIFFYINELDKGESFGRLCDGETRKFRTEMNPRKGQKQGKN